MHPSGTPCFYKLQSANGQSAIEQLLTCNMRLGALIQRRSHGHHVVCVDYIMQLVSHYIEVSVTPIMLVAVIIFNYASGKYHNLTYPRNRYHASATNMFKTLDTCK
jgi:hypothetical protein